MMLIEKINVNIKSNDIVLIGEILIDKISNEETGITKSFFGGSPANIAKNIKLLGRQPTLFAAVGNDLEGQFLIKDLNVLELNSFINVVEKKTSVVEINNSIETPIPKFNRESDYHILYSNELIEAVNNTKILHFSYWPLSKEPSKSTLLKVIDLVKGQNIIIGFDPNYHLDLVSNESISFQELKELMRKVDIIKPSLDDSKRIFGDGFSYLEYINKFQKLGIKLIVLTLGKDGIIFSYKDIIYKLPSYAKKIVDATGAGDAFWGGLYTGILNGDTIDVSLKLGLACSAYNLKQVGTTTIYPTVEELKKEFNIR